MIKRLVQYILFARWIIPLAVISGALAGAGGYTFIYAQGLSYLSSDPAACVNCHIMRDEFDSWRKGPHHAAATCVDCHLPHYFAGKYIAKGLNGYHHSKAFTLQDFHEPVMIKERNAGILQGNCIRCHGDMVENVIRMGRTETDKAACVHCHRRAGHGD